MGKLEQLAANLRTERDALRAELEQQREKHALLFENSVASAVYDAQYQRAKAAERRAAVLREALINLLDVCYVSSDGFNAARSALLEKGD